MHLHTCNANCPIYLVLTARYCTLRCGSFETDDWLLVILWYCITIVYCICYFHISSRIENLHPSIYSIDPTIQSSPHLSIYPPPLHPSQDSHRNLQCLLPPHTPLHIQTPIPRLRQIYRHNHDQLKNHERYHTQKVKREEGNKNSKHNAKRNAINIP